MTYLALGDSISIDDYTGVQGGGAAAQLAGLLKADPFLDLTRDGKRSRGVREDLSEAANLETPKIDAVTLTIGGNDLLSGYYMREVGERDGERVALDEFAENLRIVTALLKRLDCPVIMNTIYDPTDGDDTKAVEMQMPSDSRLGLNAANGIIRDLAAERDFLLCDLEALFHGHGAWSEEPWLVLYIEPNLAGATAIARKWYELLNPLGGR